MASLPQYLMGNTGLDFEPLERGIARYQQNRELQRRFEMDQQRLGMEQQRIGMEGERLGMDRTRLGWEGERQPGLRDHQNLQNESMRIGNRQALTLEPYNEWKAYQEQQLRDKQIQGDPLQAFDPEKRYGFKDPKAPGGVRWLDMPDGDRGPGQKKFDEEAAKNAAERYAGMVKHGDAQPQTMFDLQRLEELSRVVGNPTAATQFAARNGAWLKALGIEPKNMASIESFSSLISKMAPNLRPPGSGATSDFDLQQYLNSLPQVAQTPEGRKAVLQHQKAVAQYSVAQAEIAKRVLLRQMSREQGERALAELPDPHLIWRNLVGQDSPTRELPPAQGGPRQTVAPPQPIDRTQSAIPPAAVKDLHADPTPQAMQEFDAVFGPGAAKRALRMQ